MVVDIPEFLIIGKYNTEFLDDLFYGEILVQLNDMLDFLLPNADSVS